ncbi:MAG: type IV pilus biogenesis/stability protein PilW [Candidatus Competibacteraceae bacterium]|jgi:type IV pilus assembly protein PilF|nr:type IV pilus biogenesis/stability protein PilW [Candidatus Competibacteraceae bacterium]
MRVAASLSIPVILVMLQACSTVPVNPPEGNAANLNYQLGVGYMQRGHFDVAQEKLEKALTFQEDFPEVHNALAVLYDEQGFKELAEEHFQRAIALDSNYALAVKNYGQFLCRNNHPADGEALLVGLAQSAAASPTAVDAYINAAACALSINEYPRAEGYLLSALEIDSQAVVALYRLAELYYINDDLLQARAHLRRYHAQARPSPESLWLGVTIEEKLGEEQLRRTFVARLLEQFPDSAQAQRLK